MEKKVNWVPAAVLYCVPLAANLADYVFDLLLLLNLAGDVETADALLAGGTPRGFPIALVPIPKELVRVRYEVPDGLPLRIGGDHDEVLESLSVSRGQGTVFNVAAEQWSAVEEAVSGKTTPTWLQPEDDAKQPVADLRGVASPRASARPPRSGRSGVPSKGSPSSTLRTWAP